ncbi:MAG: hypothetical protein E7509_00810 [Ruminococcus sp.]|nr:hypothetical protein [Ruminococcus sp.]
MLKTVLRYFTVFVFGALAYGLIEITVRGYSHISMGILGGLTMTLITVLNNARRHGLPTIVQLLVTTVFITASELVTGIIININMKLNVWDYSDMPFNYKGQICLPFVFLWFLLSILGMYVDEILRWKFFKTDYPHLRFFAKNRIS